MPASSPAPFPPLTVYFDGVCSLCNGFVDFLIRRDAAHGFRYASQQGTTFAAFRARHPELDLGHGMETIVAVEALPDGTERVHLESDATFAILARLPGAWGWLRWGKAVPRPLRNLVYGWIARHRYRLFGKRETCRLPSPQERALFLD